MISNLFRCFRVASDKRHDHANGTLTVRPSANCAVMLSSVTLIPIIRGSLSAAMFIPCLQNLVQVPHDENTYPIQFRRRESIICSQNHRLKPVLAHRSFTTNVNMHWLITVKAVEEETKGAGNTTNCWHRVLLSPDGRRAHLPDDPIIYRKRQLWNRGIN